MEHADDVSVLLRFVALRHDDGIIPELLVILHDVRQIRCFCRSGDGEVYVGFHAAHVENGFHLADVFSIVRTVAARVDKDRVEVFALFIVEFFQVFDRFRFFEFRFKDRAVRSELFVSSDAHRVGRDKRERWNPALLSLRFAHHLRRKLYERRRLADSRRAYDDDDVGRALDFFRRDRNRLADPIDYFAFYGFKIVERIERKIRLQFFRYLIDV